MPERSNKYWFRAKRYGYGWSYPLTWQGWVAFALFAIMYAADFVWLFLPGGEPSDQRLLVFLAVIFTDSAALVWISYKRGEPARWRWGKRK